MFLLVVPLKSVQHGDSDHLMHKKHHKKRFRGNSMALSTTHTGARAHTHTHTAVFMHHVLPHTQFFLFLKLRQTEVYCRNLNVSLLPQSSFKLHLEIQKFGNFSCYPCLLTFRFVGLFFFFSSPLMVGCRTCINPAASIISQAREVVGFVCLFLNL